ncbi:MAG: family 43 glycosylhydrolase [Ferruginibacter sp.]|nr:family 43 glycosylhydrolase [Ferruginibacter sp.]
MTSYTIKILSAFLLLIFIACTSTKVANQNPASFISNPIMPGYFADPSILQVGERFYIYATIDPWGGDELAVFETVDFKNFTRHHLNWPTKAACTSPTSGDAKVWAPSVRQAGNKYYMYLAVGSEIWAGSADSPVGPWKNLKADNSPLVKRTEYPGVHNIDPDLFIDTNGEAYLFWGSGFNWVNGHCMAVKLKSDFVSFDGPAQEVTPPKFFEGPHMINRNGKYYLMFSEGKAIDATYQVGYATGPTPLGPFTAGVNDPILSTSADSTIYGPGHHTVFSVKGQDYIFYHRIFPQKQEFVLRQLCIDSLNYDEAGNIRKITPIGVANFTQKK